MAFRDLEEGLTALFDEARRDEAFDYEAIHAGSLRLDTWTGRAFAHEANYIAAARCAPGITRWHCPNCGEEMELRPGSVRPVHMGDPRNRCPSQGSAIPKGDWRRRVDAELRRREPNVIERRPCPHCGGLRTHVLTGRHAGRIYHIGRWERLEPPCVPMTRAS